MELVEIPAWQAKYKLNENPEDFAHMGCCRDLDWRRAICGYVEDPSVMHYNVYAMCVETAESMRVTVGDRQCTTTRHVLMMKKSIG